MSIFGFKKNKGEKLEQNAQASKALAQSKTVTKDILKKTDKVQKVVATKVKAPSLKSEETSSASIIIRPRITEKSGILSQSGVYTFEISKNANKNTVSKAFTTLYKVSPIKVSIVNIPAKNVFVRGKKGVVSGFKKAVITVKKGEKIDFV